MKKLILSLFLLTSLASCSAEYQEKVRKAQLEEDSKKCESYGAKRGSDDFINCMATIESGRQTMIVREPNGIPDYLYRYR